MKILIARSLIWYRFSNFSFWNKGAERSLYEEKVIIRKKNYFAFSLEGYFFVEQIRESALRLIYLLIEVLKKNIGILLESRSLANYLLICLYATDCGLGKCGDGIMAQSEFAMCIPGGCIYGTTDIDTPSKLCGEQGTCCAYNRYTFGIPPDVKAG